MRIKKKYVLGIIGYGRMGSAIAQGAISREYLERYQICTYDPSEACQKKAVSAGVALVDSVEEVARNSRIVLFSFPRSELPEVLTSLKGIPVNCLLSIIKGITASYYHEYLPDVPVIRALVNTPLKICEGATAMSMGKGVSADDYDFSYNLFKCLGTVETIREEKMDNIQVVHAEAPAYICCFVSALLKGYEEHVSDEDSARQILVQSLIGTARLLQEDRTTSLQEVIGLLCDNDGPSVKAMETLQEQGIEEMIRRTAEVTLKRINEDSL